MNIPVLLLDPAWRIDRVIGVESIRTAVLDANRNAVLNGIVLIEHLKTLKVNGNMCLHELIIQGTKDRLRPVMLTAGAAAMGFLPMALSTGAGAEVQRPLATVVIGGLFTSTLLTMIALPLLFEVFYNVVDIKFFPLRFIRSSRCGVILLLLLPISSVIAQGQPTFDHRVHG